jgi:hypothetical protein
MTPGTSTIATTPRNPNARPISRVGLIAVATASSGLEPIGVLRDRELARIPNTHILGSPAPFTKSGQRAAGQSYQHYIPDGLPPLLEV